MQDKLVIMMSDIHRDTGAVKREVNKVGKENIELLISLGDDSLNYFGGKKDTARKRELVDIGIPILLVRGNHDKRPETIKSYHEGIYLGGKVYYEEEHPNLYFAKTGEVYKLRDYTGEEQSVVVIGGGYSIDKYKRREMGIPYFKDELITEEEKEKVEKELKKGKIDYILSHVAPERYEPRELFLNGYDQSKVNKSMENWLDDVYENTEVKKWYFGHYHGEKVIDNLRLVYKKAIEFGK